MLKRTNFLITAAFASAYLAAPVSMATETNNAMNEAQASGETKAIDEVIIDRYREAQTSGETKAIDEVIIDRYRETQASSETKAIDEIIIDRY